MEVTGQTLGKSLCGNSQIDTGELCDDGSSLNDSELSNCTEFCVFIVPDFPTVDSSVPSLKPTTVPSDNPSLQPSNVPSQSPSIEPSGKPSQLPSIVPIVRPSAVPSPMPSTKPSSIP